MGSGGVRFWRGCVFVGCRVSLIEPNSCFCRVCAYASDTPSFCLAGHPEREPERYFVGDRHRGGHVCPPAPREHRLRADGQDLRRITLEGEAETNLGHW